MTRARQRRTRRGMQSLELVMTSALILPLTVAALFLGSKMAHAVYQAITVLVCWPYM